MFAIDHLLASFYNGIGHFFTQKAKFMICLCCCKFNHGQRFTYYRVEVQLHSADAEVFEGAQGLNAIIIFIGNLAITQKVMLCPGTARFILSC